MLTEEQRAIIKSTVPLLQAGGEALTTHFYRRLLDEHPSLRPMFNQAHQASGTQARALARGVLMYASHIDNLEALGPLAAQIINKHVSLNVQAEHYPLVGQCLLASMRDVLGEATATPAVIEAWAAAYGQLADILIGAEKSHYEMSKAAPGGWTGKRQFRVIRRVTESAEVVSFYLKPVDGQRVIAAAPGQYIGLAMDVEGTEVRRNYSLSAPANGEYVRISVKRHPAGQASRYLHDTVQVDSELALFPPAGEFTLRPGTSPVVFISGGVGLTPLLPMAEAALSSQRVVHFLHFARDAKVHAFAQWALDLEKARPNFKSRYWYDDSLPGLTSAERVRSALHSAGLKPSGGTEVYLVGPPEFMGVVYRYLTAEGFPAHAIRYEAFGPALTLEG